MATDAPARSAETSAAAASMQSSMAPFRTRVRVKDPMIATIATVIAAREAADDLTRIPGLTAVHQKALYELGFRRLSQLANWRRDDVWRVRQALGLGRDVSRLNWIEHAALLVAQPDQAAARGCRIDWHALPSPPLTTSAAAAAETATGPPVDLDRLDLLSGMDPATESLLASGGIRRASHIAAWSSREVRRWTQRLGAQKGLAARGWIEQAAMLAAGTPTAYARQMLAARPLETIPAIAARHANLDDAPALLARLSVAIEQRSVSLPVAPEPAAPKGPARGLQTLSRSGLSEPPPMFVLPPLPLAHHRVASHVDRAATSPAVPEATIAAWPDPLTETVAVAAAALVSPRLDGESSSATHPGRDARPLAATADDRPTRMASALAASASAPELRPQAGSREPTRASTVGRITLRIEGLERGKPGLTRDQHNATAAEAEGEAAHRLDLPALDTNEAEVLILTGARAGGREAMRDSREGARPAGREALSSLTTIVDGSSYSAYRSAIEEASVEIVRARSAPLERKTAATGATSRAEDGLASRFFQALTGRGRQGTNPRSPLK